MKRPYLAAALLLCLTGCSRETVPADTQPPTETAPVTEAETSSPSETPTAAGQDRFTTPDAPAEPTETPEAAVQYRALLTTLLTDNVLPDGKEVELGKPEETTFAVTDMDGDGKPELLLRLHSADTCQELLYGTDADGFLKAELKANAEVSWFSGGVATEADEAGDYTGAFVPYTLWEYEADVDGYRCAAYVNALSRAALAAEDNEDEYPEEADTSSSGTVYYIGSDLPSDVTEYTAWHDTWAEGAEALTPECLPLTEENIAAVLP